MRRYVVRRLLQFLPTFVGVTLITFVLLQLAPGDPVTLMSDDGFGTSPNPTAIEAWRALKVLEKTEASIPELRRIAFGGIAQQSGTGVGA